LAKLSQVTRSQPFPNPSAGPWEVEVRFGVVQGRIGCVGLEIRPLGGTPLEPLSATIVRSIRLRRLIADALVDAGPDLQRLAGVRRKYGASLGDMRKVGLGPLADDRKRPGPKPKDRAHYEQVAEIYLSAPDAPTKAVAQRLHASRSTASKWVAGARQRGLIPPTTQGRRS
jgi:hypothetical protein